MPPSGMRRLAKKSRTTNERPSPYNITNRSTYQRTTGSTSRFDFPNQQNAPISQRYGHNSPRPNLRTDDQVEVMDFQEVDVSCGRDFTRETKITNLRIHEGLIIGEQQALLEHRNAKLIEIELHRQKIVELQQTVNQSTGRLTDLQQILLQVRIDLSRLGSFVSNFVGDAASVVAHFIPQFQQAANPTN